MGVGGVSWESVVLRGGEGSGVCGLKWDGCCLPSATFWRLAGLKRGKVALSEAPTSYVKYD